MPNSQFRPIHSVCRTSPVSFWVLVRGNRQLCSSSAEFSARFPGGFLAAHMLSKHCLPKSSPPQKIAKSKKSGFFAKHRVGWPDLRARSASSCLELESGRGPGHGLGKVDLRWGPNQRHRGVLIPWSTSGRKAAHHAFFRGLPPKQLYLSGGLQSEALL